MLLNSLGAPMKSALILFTSWITAIKSPIPNPKLILIVASGLLKVNEDEDEGMKLLRTVQLRGVLSAGISGSTSRAH
jgi:hypothetical protein